MARCLILHQHVPPGAPPDEQDVLEEVAAVEAALRELGWQTARRALTLDLSDAAAALAADPPDLVFNMVESLPGAGSGGPLATTAPALLTSLGLRFTGSGFAAIALTADKRATRAALRAAGVMVPPGADAWPGPFIVKHACEHASLGLDAHSVVTARPRPPDGWFAEAFIDGREFNVALVGPAEAPEALPVAEMVFAADWPEGVPRILDYAGKWEPDHPLYAKAWREFGTASPALSARMVRIARQAWAATQCAGYARVDFRVARDGTPWALEVNTNPCLTPEMGLAAAAERAGWSYRDLVGRIVAAAQPARPAAPRAVTARRAPPQVALRRHLLRGDEAAIGALVRATGFFTEAECAVAVELAEDRLRHGAASSYRFLIAEQPHGQMLGYACLGPTPCTESAWDLYWIAVHPLAQGSGIGRRLAGAAMAEMESEGGTRLYAETSSRPLYAPTRGFYAGSGFTLVSEVPDFYAPGDAKQIWVRTDPANHTAGHAALLPEPAAPAREIVLPKPMRARSVAGSRLPAE